MTDIGIDLKALRVSNFQEITGLVDEALASRYMETAWNAVSTSTTIIPRSSWE